MDAAEIIKNLITFIGLSLVIFIVLDLYRN